METKVIDYTETKDRTLNSANGKRVGKFILVAQDGRISLVLGLVDEFPYHANLLDRFCGENEVPAGWGKKPDIFDIFDQSYRIRGGGWFEIDTGQGTLRFFGKSQAYGRYCRDDLNLVLTDNPALSGFSITTV